MPSIPYGLLNILGRLPFLIVPLLKVNEYLLSKEPIIFVVFPSTIQSPASLCIAP